MGLSSEERIKGLMYAVNEMTEHTRQLKAACKGYENDTYGPLIKSGEDLWYALLGNTSNSLHWFMGSSAANEVTWYTGSPWGLGVNHHCQGILKDRDECAQEFDPFVGFLDVSHLLRQADSKYYDVFLLYAGTEQAFYYLNRYEDDFSKDLQNLTRVLCDIQGACFNLFKTDEVYAQAYVLNAVCKLIYGPTYNGPKDKMDPVATYLVKASAQHDLSRIMQLRDQDLKMVANLHVKLQKAQKTGRLTDLMRLEAFMELAGRRYHYQHQFKEMIRALEKLKLADKKRLEISFKKCVAAHQADEEQGTRQYKDNKPSPLSIYDLSP